MNFQLTSCNNGLAPAYNVQLTDLLASQLNETSITTPVVAVGGTTLIAGTDYTYTPPAGRGGTMNFVLSTPVNPGQCVTIDYTIGFHTDIAAADQTWSNSATLHRVLSRCRRMAASTLPPPCTSLDDQPGDRSAADQDLDVAVAKRPSARR